MKVVSQLRVLELLLRTAAFPMKLVFYFKRMI